PARAALDHRPSARRARAAAGGRRAGGLGDRGLAVSVARVRGHGRGVPATVSRPEADAAARRCAPSTAARCDPRQRDAEPDRRTGGLSGAVPAALGAAWGGPADRADAAPAA